VKFVQSPRASQFNGKKESNFRLLLKSDSFKLDAAMETQLVYLSIPQGTLEKLEIAAAQKGLAVEQVVQEAIDEFLERPIHLNSWKCA
jgi:hypothetical protein